MPTSAKGHLSNERRLCKDTRDWVAEVEASYGYLTETHKIAIRKWRDASKIIPQILSCPYRANQLEPLKKVASWSYDRHYRIHFEWVWDGQIVYIVQADECRHLTKGVVPKRLVQTSNHISGNIKTELFRIVEPDDFLLYRKLANVNCYQKLDYTIVDFFVLDNAIEMSKLIKNGICSKKLLSELDILTTRPLVIRTDGVDIPHIKRNMLPRSDELRSSKAAKDWLLNTFRKKIIELDLNDYSLCLIAHHFVPATTSAWCQAYPDRRRVRIESLWGIPEGLYWYAHDVFDVDTLYNVINTDQKQPKNFDINERLRYKGQFIAPNADGKWVLHQTADESTWQRSICNKKWIYEIAWTSRRIATAENKPVVVMWLIDIPKTISKHSVMPWFHEEWKNFGGPPKAAPRKKLPSSTEFIIQTQNDWKSLQANFQSAVNIVRVLVDPKESVLFRDQKFAEDLAKLAKEKNFIVELSGGILSHVYYLLINSGCKVECADLYAVDDEKIEFNKLVRDKIPERIQAGGEDVELLKLEGEALIAALKRKIIEEAFEVADTKTSQQLIEEVADLYEVIDALTSTLGINKKIIKQAQKQKSKKRGAFENGVMLKSTKLESSVKASELIDREQLFPLQHSNDRTISRVEQIPSQVIDINIDKRRDISKTVERQFSITLPVYMEEFKSERVHFSLETHEGNPHPLILEAILERTNMVLRCKIRLINDQFQLELPESDFH